MDSGAFEYLWTVVNGRTERKGGSATPIGNCSKSISPRWRAAAARRVVWSKLPGPETRGNRPLPDQWIRTGVRCGRLFALRSRPVRHPAATWRTRPGLLAAPSTPAIGLAHPQGREPMQPAHVYRHHFCAIGAGQGAGKPGAGSLPADASARV